MKSDDGPSMPGFNGNGPASQLRSARRAPISQSSKSDPPGSRSLELAAAEQASAVDCRRDLNRERPLAVATTAETREGLLANGRGLPTRAAWVSPLQCRNWGHAYMDIYMIAPSVLSRKQKSCERCIGQHGADVSCERSATDLQFVDDLPIRGRRLRDARGPTVLRLHRPPPDCPDSAGRRAWS